MCSGFQTTGLSYWDHGSVVAIRFNDLISDDPQMMWRYPTWFTDNAAFIKTKLSDHKEKITEYQQWHDCGKPYCRIVDETGKVHYPDHAKVSADIWRSLGGDSFIGDLIEHDMDCHLLRTNEALEFSKNPNALILLCTALCEIHANASMFGGIQSDSFKIKFKRLEKCGAIILKVLTKE